MFATQPATYADIDAAEHELVRLERIIARARRRQTELLAWLDEVKVARVHGSRSMEEWTAAHLDVAATTARDLVVAARATPEAVPGVRDVGEVSFDRTVALLGLAAAGASEADLAGSSQRDLKGVRRLAAKLRRISRVDEREAMRRRHLTIEPTLGETAWRIGGLAPSYDGHVIAKALQQRADGFPSPPAGEREGRTQRMLDALLPWPRTTSTASRRHMCDAGWRLVGHPIRRHRKCCRYWWGARRGHRCRTKSRPGHHRPHPVRGPGGIGCDNGRPVTTTDRTARSHLPSGTRCCTATEDASSTGAVRSIASKPTTSATANTTAITNPTTSPRCAGTTTTS